MDDLIAFLRARLDEDEQTARAVGYERIEVVDYLWESKHLLLQRDDGEAKATSELDASLATHIARHDPARVLAEVDAKRRTVELHGPATLHAGGGAAHFETVRVCRSCEPPKQFPETAYPCATLRLLALPYASHPDYRDAWRP